MAARGREAPVFGKERLLRNQADGFPGLSGFLGAGEVCVRRELKAPWPAMRILPGRPWQSGLASDAGAA